MVLIVCMVSMTSEPRTRRLTEKVEMRDERLKGAPAAQITRDTIDNMEKIGGSTCHVYSIIFQFYKELGHGSKWLLIMLYLEAPKRQHCLNRGYLRLEVRPYVA